MYIASALLFRRSRRNLNFKPPSEEYQSSEMAEEGRAPKPPSHWWWLERDGSINQKRSTWLQSEITELNEKTKAMLELIEADADSFSQRAELYFEKRLELISLVEDLYRSHRTLAVRFDHLKSHSLLSPDISDHDSNEEYYPQHVQPIQESNFNNKFQLQYSRNTESDSKEDDELLKMREEMEKLRKETETQKEQMIYEDKENREVIRQLNLANQLHREEEEEENDLLMKLREEMEKLREENETQKEELMYKDKQNREAIRELNLAIQLFKEKEENEKDVLMKLREEIEKLREENESQKEQLMYKDEANQTLKEEENDELLKLRMEMENLREENETQKEQIMYKEKENNEAIRELNLAIQLFKQEEEKENGEMMKLREETERLKEENEIQKEKLMQKDEEKMEVIRQLSMAMDLLREEKVAAIRGSSSRTNKNRCGVDMHRQQRLCSRLFG